VDGEYGDDENTDDEASLAPSDVTNEVIIYDPYGYQVGKI
jgi:hypothetical protein